MLLPALFILSCDKTEEEPDGTTEEVKVKGCMDPESLTYNPEATEDDGSCKFVVKKNNPVVADVSATWCGPCGQYGIPAFEAISKELGDRIVAVNCQAARSTLATEASLALSAAVFKTTSIPKFFANHNAFGVYTTDEANVSAASQFVNQIEAETVEAAMYGEFSMEAPYNAKAKVWTKFFEAAEGTYQLGVYLLEDGLIAKQNGGADDQEHNHVLKGALSDNLGTVLAKTTFAADEVVEMDFEKSFYTVKDVEKTHVVAILFTENADKSLKIVNSVNLTHTEE